MDLYQLAMELDERSADVAERAEALGLGSVGPTSPLTPEQVTTLRAAYRKPEAPEPSGPVTVIGSAASGAQEPPGPPSVRSGRAKTIGIVVGCVLALGAAVAFFAVQSSPAEERRQQMAQDLADWEEAPPATVAPEVEAAVTFPPNVPRDRAAYCAAWATVVEEEGSAPEIDGLQRDFSEYRAWLADRSAWGAALDEAKSTGPTDGVPAITTYRDVQARYYGAALNASDSDLRGLADGIELNDLEGWERDADDAMGDVAPHLTPHCGELTS
jgi:hypothetical protein